MTDEEKKFFRTSATAWGTTGGGTGVSLGSVKLFKNKGLGEKTDSGGHNPKHKGQKIGVKHSGAIDFNLDHTNGAYITVFVQKDNSSTVYKQCILLPKAQPVIDDPGADPNSVIDCSQQGVIPYSANSSTTNTPTGSSTSLITKLATAST